jgi:hypothetical protein
VDGRNRFAAFDRADARFLDDVRLAQRRTGDRLHLDGDARLRPDEPLTAVTIP